MRPIQEQVKVRCWSGWLTAPLLLVIALLCLQSCATNYRGDYRFARPASSDEYHSAEYSVSGTIERSGREDASLKQTPTKYKSSQPGHRSNYSEANNRSGPTMRAEMGSFSDKTFSELFSGPLVGFVGGSLPLMWTHPFLWLGAMALAVIFDPVVMEYMGPDFFAP